ncbi:MAG: DNA/RNA non-specific endonuclease [Muribaculaceae bacterium]|nr:DNA/RNA non-specific endonuclease [Muribaculaceae bacterium]
MAEKRRHNKKHVDSASVKSTLALIMVAALLISVAYSTCAKSDSEDYPLPYDEELTELTHVISPNIEDGEMLHYPGFDVYFSNIHRQPYYVSWVLTPEHASSKEFKRSNNFRPDPDVVNSPLLSDYRNSGFDRGHMAPSADFHYSEEAQEATFFLTNMSPQRNALNSGAWANLEEQCRNWAIRDSTLVIITGPILSDYLTQSIGESHITVPDRYFKVVYAPYANPPRAIAFIMPNYSVPGGVQQSVVTVDDVESITGFDFFSSLPDELENSIESESRYSRWQFSKKQK